MKTPLPLSFKEKQVLEFIENYLQLHSGLAPSYTDIKSHFGFASYNSVQTYLKKLQAKGYIHCPGDNQKRAMRLLRSSQAIEQSLNKFVNSALHRQPSQTSTLGSTSVDLHSTEVDPNTFAMKIPLLGQVAAGRPIEAYSFDEFVVLPTNFVKQPQNCFALRVVGQSMIEDGILDGDFICVQKQKQLLQGEIAVVTIDNEATVKRVFLHKDKDPNSIELRPANSSMSSMWYSPRQVDVKGVVVGLIRKY